MLQVISLSFRKTEKNSVVYTYSKAEEGEKSKPIQIEWSKRNDSAEIDLTRNRPSIEQSENSIDE